MKYRKRRSLLLKRKHIKIIIIIAAAILAIAVIIAVSSANRVRSEKLHAVEQLAQKGVINIGLRGDIGALSTFNEETGEFEGLEKDMADELVRRLFGDDIIIDYILVNSETKDAQLKLGNIDMSLGASINADKSGIEYSDSYFGDASALLVLEGSMSSSAQLNGKTVAVVQGSVVDNESKSDEELTVLQEYLLKQNVEVTVRTYASYPEAITALRSGVVSAVCASEISLKLFGVKGMLVLPDRFLPSRYCVQVGSANSGFVDALNDVIAQMRKDGTLEALIAKRDLVDYSALD